VFEKKRKDFPEDFFSWLACEPPREDSLASEPHTKACH
jgi:hypothetical protein